MSLQGAPARTIQRSALNTGSGHRLTTALDQADKKPPGLARAETLLRGLRAIDPGFAPGDVKAALAGYTAALEGALDVAKAGKDTSAFDRDMAAQKQKFAEAILRHK